MVSFVAGLLPSAALVLSAVSLSTPHPAPGQPPVPPPQPAAQSSPRPVSLPRAPDLAAGPVPTASTTPAGSRVGVTPRAGWRWPLSPTPAVTRRFQAPQSHWGAGHRGVDLAAAPGQPVLAASSGVVTHVGVIAGRGTVTVLHTNGVRTTYEPVSARVLRGEAVDAGQVLGVVEGNSHCGTCLHLGALRGRAYLDPLTLLSPRRVVLLPLGGSQAPLG